MFPKSDGVRTAGAVLRSRVSCQSNAKSHGTMRFLFVRANRQSSHHGLKDGFPRIANGSQFGNGPRVDLRNSPISARMRGRRLSRASTNRSRPSLSLLYYSAGCRDRTLLARARAETAAHRDEASGELLNNYHLRERRVSSNHGKPSATRASRSDSFRASSKTSAGFRLISRLI